MRSPSRVGHGRLAEERLVHVDLDAGRDIAAILQLLGRRSRKAFSDVLAKSSDLPDLLEQDDGAGR